MGRREGSITPKGPGRWLIRWYVGTGANGKQLRRSRVVHGSRRKAERELRHILHSRDQGVYVEPSKLTVDEYLDRWLNSLRTSESVTERTWALYESLLRNHVRPHLGARTLQKLNTPEVQEVVDSMQGRSPETRRKVSRIFRQALNRAIRWGLIVRNPADGLSLPKRRKNKVTDALTVRQARAFLEEARGTRWSSLWELMLATGCRPQEALGLRWRDIDLKIRLVALGVQVVTLDARGRLKLSGHAKTEASLRTNPLPLGTVRSLQRHRSAQGELILRAGSLYARELDLVFGNGAGAPMDLRNLARREFAPLARAIGVPQATPYGSGTRLQRSCSSPERILK